MAYYKEQGLWWLVLVVIILQGESCVFDLTFDRHLTDRLSSVSCVQCADLIKMLITKLLNNF